MNMLISREQAIAEMKSPLRYPFVGNESRFEENIVENI